NENKEVLNSNRNDHFDSSEYRKIYYSKVKDKKIIARVQNRIQARNVFIPIQGILENENIRDYRNRQAKYCNRKRLIFSNAEINIRKLKNSLFSTIYLFWEKLIKAFSH